MSGRVSEFYCGICGKSSRYRHKDATCENVRCGKFFCRQRSAAKFCSDYCRTDARRQRQPARGRLRVERDEARRFAVMAWRQIGTVPADAPRWLRLALSPTHWRNGRGAS